MPRPHELLLAETAWLGRLARELVPAAERDDLVQDVLLTALRRGDLPQRPRTWLATVLRNRAARRRARQHSRQQREHAVARPEADAPPAADAAIAFASHRAVVNAVEALDEPYRTAVLLRFWEGLPPREVARCTDVPVETARTRIKRGVERLRQVLDERAGNRRAWLVPLLQIDAVQHAFAAGSASATSKLVPLLIGVLTMKKILIPAAAAVVLASAIALWHSPAADAGIAPPAAAHVAVAQAEAATPAAAPAATVAAEAGQRTMVAAATQTGGLAARVTWHDGKPAADVGVHVAAADGTGPERTLRTDADGCARF